MGGELEPELQEREFWRRAGREWGSTLASERPGPFVKQLWKKFEEELPDGYIEAAIRPERVPKGKRCLTRRFGKDEGLKPDGSQKVRPIDDYTASWVNSATAARDRIVLQPLDDA